MKPIGKRRWAIAEGCLPGWSPGMRAVKSHETACILNANDVEAEVRITIFFADRDPAGPYRIRIPARRTRHVRFDDLADPEVIPRGIDYASVIECDVPIVVQHTRIDSRETDRALLTTVAYASD